MLTKFTNTALMVLVSSLLFVATAQAYPTDEPLPADIQEAINEQLHTVKSCYTFELKSTPEMVGEIELTWLITEGKSSAFNVSENTTGSTRLAQCVSNRAQQWSFDSSITGEVRFPFSFSQIPMSEAIALSPNHTNIHIKPPSDESERELLIQQGYKGELLTIARCLTEKRRTVRGNLTVGWTFEKGRPKAIHVIESTTDDPKFDTCAVKLIKRWRFDRELTGETTQTIVFK